MTQLLNWSKTVVLQRYQSGSIPTGFEWLVRYLKIQGVNLESFQEDFDLGQNNSFETVSAKIRSVYPTINIKVESFTKGIDKVNRIKSLLEEQKPCLISLALGNSQGWHIMPVVNIDETSMQLIHNADAEGHCTWVFPVAEIVWRHDYLQGGHDISWIEPTLGAQTSKTQLGS
jgi:hypothetical protein